MPAAHIYQYWKSITAIEAKEMIDRIEIAQFNRQKKQRKKQILNTLRKQANPPELNKTSKVMTTKEIVNKLMGS